MSIVLVEYPQRIDDYLKCSKEIADRVDIFDLKLDFEPMTGQKIFKVCIQTNDHMIYEGYASYSFKLYNQLFIIKYEQDNYSLEFDGYAYTFKANYEADGQIQSKKFKMERIYHGILKCLVRSLEVKKVDDILNIKLKTSCNYTYEGSTTYSQERHTSLKSMSVGGLNHYSTNFGQSGGYIMIFYRDEPFNILLEQTPRKLQISCISKSGFRASFNDKYYYMVNKDGSMLNKPTLNLLKKIKKDKTYTNYYFLATDSTIEIVLVIKKDNSEGSKDIIFKSVEYVSCC
jgi:hypothetical protein